MYICTLLFFVCNMFRNVLQTLQRRGRSRLTLAACLSNHKINMARSIFIKSISTRKSVPGQMLSLGCGVKCARAVTPQFRPILSPFPQSFEMKEMVKNQVCSPALASGSRGRRIRSFSIRPNTQYGSGQTNKHFCSEYI